MYSFLTFSSRKWTLENDWETFRWVGPLKLQNRWLEPIVYKFLQKLLLLFWVNWVLDLSCYLFFGSHKKCQQKSPQKPTPPLSLLKIRYGNLTHESFIHNNFLVEKMELIKKTVYKRVGKGKWLLSVCVWFFRKHMRVWLAPWIKKLIFTKKLCFEKKNNFCRLPFARLFVFEN